MTVLTPDHGSTGYLCWSQRPSVLYADIQHLAPQIVERRSREISVHCAIRLAPINYQERDGGRNELSDCSNHEKEICGFDEYKFLHNAQRLHLSKSCQ